MKSSRVLSHARRAIPMALPCAILIASLPLATLAQCPLDVVQRPAFPPGVNLPAGARFKLDLLESTMNFAARKGDAKKYGQAAGELGVMYLSVSYADAALLYLQHALTALQCANDVDNQAVVLGDIARADFQLGKAEEGQATITEAIELNEKIVSSLGAENGSSARARAREANDLDTLGVFYRSQQQFADALDTFNKALTIAKSDENLVNQARITMNIGQAYVMMGDFEKGIDLLKQSVPLWEQSKQKEGESATFIHIGEAYRILGQYDVGLDYFQKALPVISAAHDQVNQAADLAEIGLTYQSMGSMQQALPYLTQALGVFQQFGQKQNESIALMDIGYIALELGDATKALTYFNQALPLTQDVGDRMTQGSTLGLMGLAYARTGDRQKAIQYYNQALPILTSISNPILAADLMYALLEFHKDDQPGLAIFYGKQAIGYLQQARTGLGAMGDDVQRSFLSSIGIDQHPLADYYHALADLLISEHRLAEAQEVLDLLKDQEYSDYVRGLRPVSSPVNGTESPVQLNRTESEAEQNLQKPTEQLIALGVQWENLRKISARTPDQEKQYQEISDKLSQGSQQINAYYDKIYAMFGNNSDANREVAEVKGSVSLLQKQISQMPHAVALYTIAAKERYSIIVITGAAMVAHESAISESDLNQKVAAFQQVLRDPSKDPKPLAEELYRILFAPVKPDLDQAQAETLVWSLDGVLRYIPMAALYDGSHYLVEKYNMVSITPASIQDLSQPPQIQNANAVAMGIARKYEDNLSALPAVKTELDEIVKDPQVPGAEGVLPGTILLNGQFTEKAMENELDGHHSVVHIASHFVFEPGDDNQSYLLLAGKDTEGTGYHLTVADFRDNPNLSLTGTDLLTLSACDTGMLGHTSDGREVDGLAITAQLKGASAVIASLWDVNDASTGSLMADFYKRWIGSHGTVMKLEALRQAQLDLLHGQVKPVPDLANPNETTSISQPYYWAPFVLTGNWR